MPPGHGQAPLDPERPPLQAGAARGDTPTRRPDDNRQSDLLDLPDDLLLLILSRLDPLPDGFSAGRTCRRLHALASCDSLKLRVRAGGAAASTTPAPTTARTPRPAGRATFATLASAVAASRPGDTILLDGGGEELPCDAIPIRWPLCVRAADTGTGTRMPMPVLAATPGAPAALTLHASTRLAGLAITSSPTSGGSCLEHAGGVCVVEACSLEVLGGAGGRGGGGCYHLPFLHAPILSSARTSGAAVRLHETRLMAAGPGAVAVRAPAGVLSGVRVIQGRRQGGKGGGGVFWLTVTTQAPAWGPGVGVVGVRQSGAAAAAAAACATAKVVSPVSDLAARAEAWRAGRRRMSGEQC